MTISTFFFIFDLYEATKDLNWIQTDYINYNYLYYPESMAIHSMNKNLMTRTIENFDKNIHKLPKGKMYDEAVNIRNSIESFLLGKEFKDKGHVNKDHRELIDLEEITFRE